MAAAALCIHLNQEAYCSRFLCCLCCVLLLVVMGILGMYFTSFYTLWQSLS